MWGSQFRHDRLELTSRATRACELVLSATVKCTSTRSLTLSGLPDIGQRVFESWEERRGGRGAEEKT